MAQSERERGGASSPMTDAAARNPMVSATTHAPIELLACPTDRRPR
jgi:hypothetical protein